jgi:glycosyltransferase involved in cell wall biosynthesis
MNIFFISMDYPPRPGGISAHVFELAKALNQEGASVTVLTRRKKGDSPGRGEQEVRVVRIPLKYVSLFYGLQIRQCAKRMLPEIRPDIIHIHGIGPLKWYDIRRPPLVYTNHTSGYLMRIEKGGWYRLALLQRLFRKIDAFIAPSRELLHTPFQITADKHYIPNGVDASKYLFNAQRREQIRDELAIGADQIAIIATRRLVEKNGMIYLAQASRQLDDPRYRFIIIGDGPEHGKVACEFSKNCGNRAIFLGNKRHEDIIDYYSAADISVLPSLMEATSISGLEAMASALPLVGTRVGGIPDLIEDGFNGYLCAPKDPSDLAHAIKRLLGEDYRQMGQNSRKRVLEHFTWQVIAQKTMKVYSSLLCSDRHTVGQQH